MRIVALNQLRRGMVVARNIYDPDGRILLVAGSTVDGQLAKRLAIWNINCIYVRSGEGELSSSERPPHDVVYEETRLDAASALRKVVERAREQGTYDINNLYRATRQVVDDVLSSSNRLVEFVDLGAFSDGSFNHSVRVAVLSVMMGMDLGITGAELNKLAVGALLHDLGQMLLPELPWNEPVTFTRAEREQMRQHPRIGYDAIRRNGNLSILSAHVAYQHHERLDGSGYPRGLRGGRFHLFGRIVAVAEVYDALTNARPQRPAFWPHQAIEFLLAGAGTAYDPDVLRALVSNVALYPVGTLVQLNTGEQAEVLHTLRRYPTRPIVRITRGDGRGRAITRLPLYEDAQRFITRTLPLAYAWDNMSSGEETALQA